MIPDRDRELLTAYVDGELSSRQRRHVVRLLKRSGEARQLLHDLQKDSSAIINLGAPKLDEDLSSSVLNTIRERRLTPFRRKPQPAQPAFPAWVGMAIAASVLCAIGLASYMGFAAFLSTTPPAPTIDPMARTDGKHDQKPDKPIVRDQKAELRKDEKKPDQKKPDDRPEIVRNDTPRPEGFVGPPEPEKRPEDPSVIVDRRPVDNGFVGPPEPEQPKVEPLTNRATERFEPEMVTGVRRLFLPLHDLDQEEKHRRLLDALAKDAGYRLWLPCDNGTRAFDRLQAACRDQKIGVVIDQAAKKRLADPKAKTDYVLYVENVTPDELSRLVQQLGADDKKAAAKKPSDAHFGAIVVTPMTKRDYHELADLLGVEPSKVEPAEKKGPLGIDPRKPLSEQTEEQVVRGVAGNQALVLTYSPAPSPKNSAEVKRFLEGRKAAKPGTVRAVIVLRSV